MRREEKQKILEDYKHEKENGEYFFPDAIFKDALVALLVFLILVGLAYFVGAPLEARANPSDTSYTPRPEWYFLFFFQLLKYFPSQLEVIGVVVVPGLLVILLLLLPFIDRSSKRHFRQRSPLIGVVTFGVLGVGLLTFQALQEAPPPADTSQGSTTAALYTRNCAGCHGSTIDVEAGADLHQVIAEGTHEGMPAWNADLTTDQIDALAGFILSPTGSQLFTANCESCHDVVELTESDPLLLKQVLELGQDDPRHSGLDIPAWNETLNAAEQTALLNFLIAPDGRRLFNVYCSTCHGQSVSFSGSEEELRQMITQGGLHLEMPPWRERISAEQIDTLAQYVVDPQESPNGARLFAQDCASCHGQRIPSAASLEAARTAIAEGGAHKTMPVWGQALTPQQIDALVAYTQQAAQGTSIEQGQALYDDNCSPCHGEFGEGGINPARPGDIIAPISSAEFLSTRDDYTLRSIISQGQPNTGMSPFGAANGGPLDEEEIDAIVSYLRQWEEKPPVEFPPEIRVDTLSMDGQEIFNNICAQCHGANGEGGVGPALNDPEFQAQTSDADIFDSINLGHEATSMIGWGDVLSTAQIENLVSYIRTLKADEPAAGEEATEPAATEEVEVSFSEDVKPIFDTLCIFCHGDEGGWSAEDYESVMTSGDNGPVVVPGNAEDSLLAIKILGEQTEGTIMPPGGKMKSDKLQTILDWINAGAPDN